MHDLQWTKAAGLLALIAAYAAVLAITIKPALHSLAPFPLPH